MLIIINIVLHRQRFKYRDMERKLMEESELKACIP
jgi:hypothetical protein